MSNIYPFRNVYDQPTNVDCEICGAEINTLQGYAVRNNGCVDGYVCQSCFEQGEELDDVMSNDFIYPIPYNPAVIN